MRYLVLMRHGFGVYTVALAIDRALDGRVSCVETVARPDSRSRAERRVLGDRSGAELAYVVPGPLLLDPWLPRYETGMDGATVQIAAEDVMAEPHRVELQILLTPPGHVPEHRELVGDRLVEAGDPSIWMVLARRGPEGDGAGALAAYAPRPRPRLWAAARPPIES